MIAPDVNVLVSALRADMSDHAEMSAWVRSAGEGPAPLAITTAVAAGVVRILTHPRVFTRPSSTAEAVSAMGALLDNANAVLVSPGPRHWSILADLCRQVGATGNLVADAGHAATAIERGLTWVSKDRDFARFPGLRWQQPERY